MSCASTDRMRQAPTISASARWAAISVMDQACGVGFQAARRWCALHERAQAIGRFGEQDRGVLVADKPGDARNVLLGCLAQFGLPERSSNHCKLRRMRVLLLSMPDSFEHMAPVAIRMPNGALASLAGNIDPHHEVAIADLVLVQGRVAPTIERLIRERPPDVVGLSVMTFQRATASAVAALIRRLTPRAHIVAGGYDPSLAPDAYHATAVDMLVRGEGEHTFRALLRALEQGGDLETIRGLSHRRERYAGPQSRSTGGAARRRAAGASRSTGPRPRGLHAARAARRRGGNLARLHLRLQLLLDHRNARPQLPSVSDRSRARRHRRRQASRRPGHLPGR